MRRGRAIHAPNMPGTPVRGARRASSLVIAAALAPWLTACDRAAPPPPAAPATAPAAPATSQPAAATSTAPTPAAAPADPLPDGWQEWTLAEALEKLSDDAARVGAAVRLVRIAGLEPLCVPDPLPADFARRLGVVDLGQGWRALGLVAADGRVQAPVLIDADAAVTQPALGIEEELAVLHVSEDADVFPHVIVTPMRVLLIGEELVDALVGRDLGVARFAWVDNDGYPYVALRVPGAPEDAEAARYRWDVYESMFMGPLADNLPDPPGGRFELDLQASRALVPLGGDIPEPPQLAQPQQDDEPPPPAPF